MKYKVISKQSASKECFICGTENNSGLQADFYEIEGKRVACVFTAKSIHEGHPGILHGGVICSILDETAGRSMSVYDNTLSAYTIELTTNYMIPIPTNVELAAAAWVEEIREKVYIARAEIYLTDGSTAASARGVYYKLHDIQQTEDAYHKVFPVEMDRFEIELPEREPEEAEGGLQ